MVAFALQTLSQAGYQWLYFAITLFTLVLSVAAVFAWITWMPKRRKRKRKHHGHGRINPTLAQVGGLPEPKSSEPPPPRSPKNPPVEPLA